VIREILLASVLTIGGFGILLKSKIPEKSPTLWTILSLPVGVAFFTVFNAIAFALNINNVLAGLFLLYAVAIFCAASTYEGKQNLFKQFGALLVALGMVTILLIVVSALVSPILTNDSYAILLTGRSIGSPIFTMDSPLLNSYPMMVLNFQAIGEIFGLDYIVYLPVVTGLLAIAGSISIVSDTYFSPKRNARIAILSLYVILGIFWITTWMLRSQLGYLNSHMLMAGFYSLGLSICISRDSVSQTFGSLFSGLLIGVVAFIRLEGLLFMALLLFAIFSHGYFSKKQIIKLTAAALTAPIIWFGRLLIEGNRGDIISPKTIILMLILSLMPSLLATFKFTKQLSVLMPQVVTIGLSVIWSFYLLTSDKAVESSLVILSNLFATGYWGSFWWTFGPIALVLVVFGPRIRDENVWLELTAGGTLTVLLLGAIRTNPYRIGWGDSGNRMIFHLAPIVLLYIFAKIGTSLIPEDDSDNSKVNRTI